MPGGRRGLQSRCPDTLCRGVGSIPTLSANVFETRMFHPSTLRKEVIADVTRANSQADRTVFLRGLSSQT